MSDFKMEVSYDKNGLDELLALADKIGSWPNSKVYKNHVILAFEPPGYMRQAFIGTFDPTRKTGGQWGLLLTKTLRDIGISKEVVWFRRVIFEEIHPMLWISKNLDLPHFGDPRSLDRDEWMKIIEDSWTTQSMLEYATTLI